MLPTPAPKFRLSCDSCLAAKVKCNKEKPTCERCRVLGKGCLYSVCRKTGRPSLAVRKRSELRTPVAAYTNLAPKSPREVLHVNSPAGWMVDGPVVEMTDPGAQFDWDDLGIEGLDPLSLLHSWGAIGEDDPMQTLETQTVHSSMTTFPSTNSSETTDDSSSDDILTSDRQSKCRFGYVPATLNALIVGCDHEAYSVLGALNCASQQIRSPDIVCTTSTGAAVPTAPSSETCWNSIFQLDNILQRNKDAVRSMTELLDCSCAQEPHLAMLYVSIVSKILAGYQVVAQQLPTLAPLANSVPSNSAAAAQSGGDRESSRMRQNSTCIRIGSFELDDIDQAALHRQLLLIEICKVDSVIEKMLATSHQHSKCDRDISVAMSWYHLACLATKRKLQETKDMANVTVNDYQFRLT